MLLGLTATVFRETTGHAWNHEPGLFFALIAFLTHTPGIVRQQSGWFIASGVLLGVAVGLRLTFAPLVAPFLLLATLYSLASVSAEWVWFWRLLVAGAICVVVSIGQGRRAYGQFRQFASVGQWTPIKMYREGRELRAHISGGRVFTLAPLYPLEAGLSIYPPFATAPFAWRRFQTADADGSVMATFSHSPRSRAPVNSLIHARLSLNRDTGT